CFADPQTYDASEQTLFTQTWHRLPLPQDAAALLEKYTRLREIRAEVLRRLEELRISGAIGSSLQAEVEIKAGPAWNALLGSLGEDLKFLLITSKASVTPVASDAEQAILVTPSTDQKCERCWHYRPEVGSHPEYP